MGKGISPMLSRWELSGQGSSSDISMRKAH